MSYILDLDSLKTDLYPDNFKMIGGFYYNSFLANSNTKIGILMFFVILMMLSTLLDIILKLLTSWRNLYLMKLLKKFYWSATLCIVINLYYPLLLSLLLELNAKYYESWPEKVSFSIALLVLFALTTFYIICLIIICSNSSNKRLKITKLKFGYLLAPFKDSMIYTMYWPLQLTKVTVFAFL